MRRFGDPLKFRTGDVIVKIDTDMLAKIVCASSGWQKYYIEWLNDPLSQGTVEAPAEAIENDFVLVEGIEEADDDL